MFNYLVLFVNSKMTSPVWRLQIFLIEPELAILHWRYSLFHLIFRLLISSDVAVTPGFVSRSSAMVAIEVEPVFKAFRAISVSSALKCLPGDVPKILVRRMIVVKVDTSKFPNSFYVESLNVNHTCNLLCFAFPDSLFFRNVLKLWYWPLFRNSKCFNHPQMI